jgi:Zn finger protein HypA/HybF involved in hydrogenase expression
VSEPKQRTRVRKRGPGKLNGLVADYRPAQRMCLFCGKPFPSQGPGHRKCDKCRSKG